MKKFKRIYIEITNKCNLNCSFCSNTNRLVQEMSLEKFEIILKKINDYTDYIYLHVKGEPLLHTKLDRILELCKKYNKKVNITTNGTLLKERYNILNNSDCIRQINISLHSENTKNNYLNEVLETTSKLSNKMNIVYRFWTLDKYQFDTKSTNIVDKIVDFYNLSPEIVEKIKKEENIKLANNIYISKANKFIWPSLSNTYYQENGYCYGLKTQLAILSDGRVVPCCLDGEGTITLGNILKEDLSTILNSKEATEILTGFMNRKACHELCKHCSYKERFNRF